MTRIYLVRHGETVDNVRKIMQGQTDGQLTPHGMEQAEIAARRLSGVDFAVVLSSDLKRAVDTARVIAAKRGKEVVRTPLLRERDWGGLTGKYIPGLKDAPWPDDVETIDQMRGRALRFLEMVADDYPGATVVAVGHGIFNKAIQSVHFNKPMGEIMPMSNAEIRILDIGE